MGEMKVEHVLMFALVVCALYYLMGNCGCKEGYECTDGRSDIDKGCDSITNFPKDGAGVEDDRYSHCSKFYESVWDGPLWGLGHTTDTVCKYNGTNKCVKGNVKC